MTPTTRRGDHRPVPGVVGEMAARCRAGVVVPEWHRATTRHGASLYPFQLEEGFGTNGVYVGVNVSAGMNGFFFDQFELYPRWVTSPNMIVMGDVGQGKSALVKTFARRQRAVYGHDRFLAILDPKGEYGALAHALDLPVLRLYPGGVQRLNPMDPPAACDPTNPASLYQARQELAAALVTAVLRRAMTPIERGLLDTSIRDLCLPGRPFTLLDVLAAVKAPGDDITAMARRSQLDVARLTSDVVFALSALVSNSLAGMFDGSTTATIDLTSGGFVLDLSAVFANEEAFPLVMLAAISWMNSLYRTPDRPSKVVQIIDECWAAVRHGAAFFQAALKLSRTLGVGTILVCHRPSDLTAQTDTGTSAHQIAQGLIADCQTRVLLRPPDDQLAAAATMFDLSDREATELASMHRGRALWLINKRRAVVAHVLGPGDNTLIDTDSAMVG